eukprot:9341125-Pyramimonas_sp.AAC.1
MASAGSSVSGAAPAMLAGSSVSGAPGLHATGQDITIDDGVGRLLELSAPVMSKDEGMEKEKVRDKHWVRIRNSIGTEMDGLKTSLDSRVSKTESAIQNFANRVQKLKQGDGLSVASGSTKASTDRHGPAWNPRYVEFKGW